MFERRKFLSRAATAGAATLSAPAWISRAFAQEGEDAEGGSGDNGRDRAAELRDLSAAYRRAQQQGRP
ncbi:MAG: twin-arginine translocation signal domain-containing protein, partial [Myxococcales bacterium]|nr:twin-arginine translocation signal domain-containing protein [Myxococcales bacterium]